MSRDRHFKHRQARRVEYAIQQEIARAEILLDQNAEAMRALTIALDNEPKGLAKAFAEIEQKGAGKQ